MAIEITSFKPYQKNTLQGFLTIRLTSIGLEIRDCCLHEKNGKRWIQMPGKPFQKQGGATGWSLTVDFYDKPRGDQFQRFALKALDDFRSKNRGGTDGF